MSHEQRPDSNDPVGLLLRRAGHRPRPPAGSEAEIRHVVHAAWQAKMAERGAERFRRRRQQTWYLAAAAVLGLLVGGLAWRQAMAPAGPSAVVVASVETWFPAVADGDAEGGASLVAGDEITTAEDQRVALRLAGGASVRVDHGSRLVLGDKGRIELRQGALYIDSEGSRGLEIHSPWGVARNLGTQFEVRLHDDGLRLGVRQGRVALDIDGTTHEAPAGMALEVTAAGVETSELAAQDESWDWVLAAAPSFEIEGRTLSEALAWIGRETGWEIRWQDAELEREAGPTRLHGTLDGLRPDQAHQLVVPSAGLEARLDNGVLRIERPVV